MNEIIVHFEPQDCTKVSNLRGWLAAWQYDDKRPEEWGKLDLGGVTIRFFADIEVHKTYRVKK